MLKEFVKESLNKIVLSGKVYIDEPLSKYTFTKTGGPCDFFVIPKTYIELQNVIKFSLKEDIPFTVIGNGSNMIIKDGGIKGIVISLLELNKISLNENKITAQCGATLIDTTKFALNNSLTGFEFACGIPGSVGGAVFMNAGAYGGEIKDIFESCIVIDENGEIMTLYKDDLNFSYRKSILSSQKFIVLEASFSLIPGDKSLIKDKMDELTYLRESKQPLEYPSCGSVFKRPPGKFAGKLIQDSNLQGFRIGGVEVSTKHAGFMVNVNKGTATDYLNLISYVKEKVKENYDIELETEVEIIGENKNEEF